MAFSRLPFISPTYHLKVIYELPLYDDGGYSVSAASWRRKSEVTSSPGRSTRVFPVVRWAILSISRHFKVDQLFCGLELLIWRTIFENLERIFDPY
jgi:hypothetical protein